MKIRKFLLKINPVFVLSLIIPIYYIYIKYEFIDMPLIGDEWYYANPYVFDHLSNWVHISFGHPPGWNMLNGIIYSVFGFSPSVAHWIGLICSSLSLVAIFVVANRIWPLLISLFAIVAISGHYYFIASSSYNHSIITASTCGILSLFFLNEKKVMLFAIFSTLAFLFRESSLVFIIAGVIMQRDRQTIKYALIPLTALIITYGWYFIEKNQLMLNDHMRSHYGEQTIIISRF